MKINRNMSLLLWLRGNMTKEGKKILYARITIDGLRAEISLAKHIVVKEWNQDQGCLNVQNTASRLVQKYIEECKIKIERCYDIMASEQEYVTAQMVKEKFEGKKPNSKTLLEVIDFITEKFTKKVDKKLRKFTSLRKWYSTRVKVLEFLKFQYKLENIDLSKVEFAFAEDLFDFLTLEQGLGPNSAGKYVKRVKSVFKVAVERNWLNRNPIMGYTVSYVNPDRDILFEPELMSLYKKKFSIARLEEIKDCFLFMCFTGYGYKDAKTLSPANVIKYFDGEDWIVKNRQKTICSENVPLLPIAKEIVEKYRNHPYCVNNNVLLPIRSNSNFNAYLKEIADLLEIAKKLTTHTARHTFATTVTLANGVSLETLMALLGHKNIRTTQIYGKIVATQISTDMGNLKQKLIIKMPSSLLVGGAKAA